MNTLAHRPNTGNQPATFLSTPITGDALTSPTLYQPTVSEIRAVLESVRCYWPTLATRIDKAEEILLAGNLSIDPVVWQQHQLPHWRVASQSGGTGAYRVDGRSCSCPDRAPSLDGRRMCKHIIAVAAYLRILRNGINADIHGYTVKLSTLTNGDLQVHAPNLTSVQLRYVDGVYHFATKASPIQYSIWLAQRESRTSAVRVA